MCTISFLPTPEGYLLGMNRDEQWTRQRGPEIKRSLSPAGLEAAWPLDPVSGGGWIGVNGAGLCVALMNQHPENYVRPPGLLSRGHLVPMLLDSTSSHEISQRFQRLETASFPPFLLLAVDGRGGPLHALRWDGASRENLVFPRGTRLFGSSSYRGDAVLMGRQEQFERFAATLPGLEGEALADAQAAFHASHEPQRGAWSVCLHREDAGSVSFTQVSVSGLRAVIRYHAGPPCEAAAVSEAVLS